VTNWIGHTLSKVTIQKLLGRGGMAEVYLGTHNTLNRPVAVKILHGHLLEDDSLMERFRSEAQAVANLRHPNIIQVFDFDIVEDRPYIVMELLEGPSLADYMDALHKTGQTLPFAVTGRLITGIAGALDYAHGRGIVHRDVKPSNVLLRSEVSSINLVAPLPADVQPVLTDFGVARMANATIRTASGAIVGTPAYMSPEQVSGTTVDARSDIYSLGVVLYEMLSGRLPFSGEEDTVASALIKHITEPPQPLPEVPQVVQAVVFRALAKDRSERYQKASEMALDLRQALGVPLGTREMDMLRASASVPTPPGLMAPTVRVAGKSFRSTRALWTVGLIGFLIVVMGVGILLGTGALSDKDNKTPGAASLSMENMPEESFGVLDFGSETGKTIDRATLTVVNLAPPPEDMRYEAWLLGSETRRSMGALDVDQNGSGELTFVGNTDENLLAVFGRFEITLEPDPDSNPLPTGDAVYSGAAPPGSLSHIRHLLAAFSRTPDGGGLVINLQKQADLITKTAQDMLDSQEEGDLDELKSQAEGLVNLIEGEGGEHFGDLDGDGTGTNPGDGFGLLPGARSAGYIQSSIEHARYAAGAADATASVIEHAGYFETAAQNLGGWAAQLRDMALAVIESEDLKTAEQYVQQIAELAEQFVKGRDANGNGRIEPIHDEGGMETVFYYARHMAEMPVLAGMNRVPEPASGDTTPGAAPESEHGSDMEGY
jgi:tRNA A-37 threonylcarbamoyl transferase component Bud32